MSIYWLIILMGYMLSSSENNNNLMNSPIILMASKLRKSLRKKGEVLFKKLVNLWKTITKKS